MKASHRARRKKLTDDQLDALLDSTGQELLTHIQARTDPTAALNQLLAGPTTPESTGISAVAGDTSTRYPPPPPPASHRHRPWRTLPTPIAATAGAAGLIIVIIFTAVSLAAHHVPSLVNASRLPPPSSAPAPGTGIVPGVAPGSRFGPGATPVPGIPASAHPPGPFLTCQAPLPGTGWVANHSYAIPFGSGQAGLPKTAEQVLESALKEIRQPRPGYLIRVVIVARADDALRPAYSGQLASNRAQTVCQWLIARHVPSSEAGAVSNADSRNGPSRGNQVSISIYAKPGSSGTALS